MSTDGLRVAMLSVHTSPLDQPGTGDAGGMNVYVADLATALAKQGATVDIFTRATSPELPAAVPLAAGVTVHHVAAGPQAEVDKTDLPEQLRAFTAGVLRCSPGAGPGTGGAARDTAFDVVHSHYWLSGQVGQLLTERWQVPLVHTMHTLAKVKNAALAPGDTPEPPDRIAGEEEVIGAADALIANTPQEAAELVDLYGARPDDVQVVAPGVDKDVFHPHGTRAAARAEVELDDGEPVVLFVGRVQPLKSPDVLVRALAVLRQRGRLVPRLVVVGGLSGRTGGPEELQDLAARLGVADRLVLRPPVPRTALAQWYRAADVVAIPSRSESFGLVALEAQACGTPVLAADVGGLGSVVEDGVTGVLVPGHEPGRWADALAGVLEDRARRARLGESGVRRAQGFDWAGSAQKVLAVYRAVVQASAGRPPR